MSQVFDSSYNAPVSDLAFVESLTPEEMVCVTGIDSGVQTHVFDSTYAGDAENLAFVEAATPQEMAVPIVMAGESATRSQVFDSTYTAASDDLAFVEAITPDEMALPVAMPAIGSPRWRQGMEWAQGMTWYSETGEIDAPNVLTPYGNTVFCFVADDAEILPLAFRDLETPTIFSFTAGPVPIDLAFLATPADGADAWLLDITGTDATTYHWSTHAVTAEGTDYTAVVKPGRLSLTLNTTPGGIQRLDDFSFAIPDPDAARNPDHFIGQTLTISLYSDDGAAPAVIRRFKMTVRTCVSEYQELKFTCEDLLTRAILESYLPTNKTLSAVWPTSNDKQSSGVIPIPFGTPYVRLPSAFIIDRRYIVMGPATGTYTIDRIAAPRELDLNMEKEWPATGYAFNQASFSGYRVFEPIIADDDKDGLADSAAWFHQNGEILPYPVKYSHSPTVSVTNPVDIIADLLFADIDLTISKGSAAATVAARGISLSGAFNQQKPIEELLESLLIQAGCVLSYNDAGDREIKVLSSAAKATAQAKHVVMDTFSGDPAVNPDVYDGGYVAFCEPGKPQDLLVKYQISLSAAAPVNPTDETLFMPYQADSSHARKAAIVRMQRNINKAAKAGFDASPLFITRNPDDVVTVSGENYNAATPFDAAIESMTIHEDFTVSVNAVRYTHTLRDWAELTEGLVTLADGTIGTLWSPVLAGPDSGENINVLPGRLIIGYTDNRIDLDPDIPAITLIEDGNEIVKIGDMGSGDYGIRIASGKLVIGGTVINNIADNADNTAANFNEDIADIDAAVVNFNARNDRIATAIANPNIPTNGTAIDHTANTDGSADVSFEWTWAGDNADIDGFVVILRGSASGSVYAIGTHPSEEVEFFCRSTARSIVVRGLAADLHYTFGVYAYRIVDPDVDSDGVITSATVQASASGENPYRPSEEIAFAGDISGTVNGAAATDIIYFDGEKMNRTGSDVSFIDADHLEDSATRKWAGETGADVTANQFSQDLGKIDSVAVNFDNRNDRLSGAVPNPMINTDGTAVDHTVNTDGSANLSFEWSWPGTESQIDGFVVIVRGSTSGSEYSIGTTPREEMEFFLPASRRTFILKGVAQDLHYTFGVYAYRIVDPDIDADGVITSATMQPTIAAEDPYQPASEIAFAGDITGTVNARSVAAVIYHNGTNIAQTDGTGVDADDLPESISRKWAAESGADVTQNQLDLGAAIDNATANGATLISGGYIRTNLLDVDGIIVSGDILKTDGDISSTTIGAITLISGGYIRTSLLDVDNIIVSGDILVTDGDISSTTIGATSLISGGYIRTSLLNVTDIIATGSILVTGDADKTSTVISGGLVTTGYIRSSGYSSSNGMQIDLTNAKITINEASGLYVSAYGGITVAGGGDITLQAGGDLKLYGSTTNPAQIHFYDSSSNFKATLGSHAVGTIQLWPVYNDDTSFFIGRAAAKFSQIGLYAADPIDFSAAGVWYTMGASAFYASNTESLGMSSLPWQEVWAVDGSINTSDKTKKDSISDSDLGLDFINQLKPKKWIWNWGKRPHYGLISQDVGDLLAEQGHDFAGFIKAKNVKIHDKKTDEDRWLPADQANPKDTVLDEKDEYYIRYHEFIGPMIKAIQELHDEVKSLKKEK